MKLEPKAPCTATHLPVLSPKRFPFDLVPHAFIITSWRKEGDDLLFAPRLAFTGIGLPPRAVNGATDFPVPRTLEVVVRAPSAAARNKRDRAGQLTWRPRKDGRVVITELRSSYGGCFAPASGTATRVPLKDAHQCPAGVTMPRPARLPRLEEAYAPRTSRARGAAAQPEPASVREPAPPPPPVMDAPLMAPQLPVRPASSA